MFKGIAFSNFLGAGLEGKFDCFILFANFILVHKFRVMIYLNLFLLETFPEDAKILLHVIFNLLIFFK